MVSARAQYILMTSLVLVLLSGLIIGLTVGLRTPPLENGGSPPGPQLPNDTTIGPSTTTGSTTSGSTTAGSTTTGSTTAGPSTRTSSSTAPSTTTRPTVTTISSPTSSSSTTTTSPIPTFTTSSASTSPSSPPLHRISRQIEHKAVYKSKENSILKQKEIDRGSQVGSSVANNKPQTVHNPHDEKGTVPSPFPDSASGQYKYAAVTTDTIPCSTIGTDALGRGGSAVDAAIAAAICVGVVSHHSSGIGGGHFTTIYEKPIDSSNKELMTIHAREWAPLAATRDMFVNNTEASSKGGLSIAVPGEVKGFYEAWLRYGRLPWSELYQPSIQLCNDGFIIERSLNEAILENEEAIRDDPNLSELFVHPNGSLVTSGDVVKNPKLGTTLSRIADDPHTFYNGTLADDIIADLNEYGSIITKEDLKVYEAKLKPGLSVPLSNGNLTAYSVSPPASGVIIEFIMNILNGYHFVPSSLDKIDDKVLTYHRIIEAFKFAYAKRSSLGDEDFVDVNELVMNLTSPAYGEYIRSRINDSSTQNYTYYEPDFDISIDGGTSHISVQAQDGAAVSMSLTINLYFGSNVRGSRTAIMFNDEMDDFSTPGTENSYGVPASPANYIVPGKMPMSSMNPVLIFDEGDNVVFSSGSTGGTRITTSTSFVAMQTLWFNQTLLNATDIARFHHQLMPEDVKYEEHMPQEILDGLVAKNHVVTLYHNVGNVMSIHNTCPENEEGGVFVDECIFAASDGRKGGAPDGIS